MVDVLIARDETLPVGILSGLAARRQTISKLLDVRAVLSPRSDEFGLACCEFWRELDEYIAALEEAAVAFDFLIVSRFLTTVPRDHPALLGLYMAAGDWTLGPTEARRRFVLLDAAIQRQLLGDDVRGDDHEPSHPADGRGAHRQPPGAGRADAGDDERRGAAP